METFLTTLFSAAGVSGMILGFHLWKLAPELRAIWRAIDRSNQTRLLGIMASPHVAPSLKEEAAGILADITSEESKGKNREILPP